MRRSKAPSIVRKRTTPPLAAPNCASAAPVARPQEIAPPQAPPSHSAADAPAAPAQALRPVGGNAPVRRAAYRRSGTPPLRTAAPSAPAARPVRAEVHSGSGGDGAERAAAGIGGRAAPPRKRPVPGLGPPPAFERPSVESSAVLRFAEPCVEVAAPEPDTQPSVLAARAQATARSNAAATVAAGAGQQQAEEPPNNGGAPGANMQPVALEQTAPVHVVMEEEDMLDLAAAPAVAPADAHPPADAGGVDAHDKPEVSAVTDEWLTAAVGATVPTPAGANRLLGRWLAVGRESDTSGSVNEEFVLRACGGVITGENCPGADELFTIKNVTTAPAPEVHNRALAVSFLQVYADGAETRWRSILPNGNSSLRDGTWEGEATGSFTATRQQAEEPENKDVTSTFDNTPVPIGAMELEDTQLLPSSASNDDDAAAADGDKQDLRQPAAASMDTTEAPTDSGMEVVRTLSSGSALSSVAEPAAALSLELTAAAEIKAKIQANKERALAKRAQRRLQQEQQKTATPAAAAAVTSYKPAWKELPADATAPIPSDTSQPAAATAEGRTGQKRPGEALEPSQTAKRQASMATDTDNGTSNHVKQVSDDSTAAAFTAPVKISEEHLELVKNLNRSQQDAAVSDINKPLLILAGPGSGKTATLTNRILFFLANGVHPSKILAVSFTNAAAAEMGSRVKKLVKEARSKGQLPEIEESEPVDPDDRSAEASQPKISNDVETSTFHSVALKIVREHASLLGLSKEFQLFGDGQQYNVVREGLRRYRQEGSSLADADAVTAGFNPPKREVNNSLKELNQAKSLGKKISPTKEPELHFISKHYTQALKDCDAIDFQDIMTKSLLLMQKHPEVQTAFQEKFSHILIDEFQDTNKIQYDLMRAVVSGTRLTVVGDDDQSIFAFQGATGRDVFSNMRTDYPGIKSIRLEENYRSTAIIVAASSAIIKKSLSREQKQAISMQDQGDPITVIECPTVVAEADYVLKAINHEVSNGMKHSDIAILYRRNVTGKYFQDKLLEQAIPFNHHDVCFYRRKMIKAVIFLMRIACNLKDDASFEKAFLPLLEDNGLENPEAHKVINRIRVMADLDTLSMYDAAKKQCNVKISGSLSKPMLAAGRKAIQAIGYVRMRAPKADSVAALLTFAVGMTKAKDRFSIPICKQGGGSEGMLLNDSKETRTPLEVLMDDVEAFEETRQIEKASTSESAAAAEPSINSQDTCMVGVETSAVFSIMSDDPGATPSPPESPAAVAQAAAASEPVDRMGELKAFLSYITEVEMEQYKKIKSDNENAISLLTIHRSKGLEWKVVFVIKMNEGELPMSFDQAELEKTKESQALQEERRLCFVAWSRASIRLYLTYRQQGDMQGQVLQPSRYLSDIDRNTIDFVQWNPSGLPVEDGAAAAGGQNVLSCDPNSHAFYKQISPEHRASVALLFNKWSQMKAFAEDPTRLVSKVKAVCLERLAKKNEGSKPALREILQAVKESREMAADYGRVWVEYQNLPSDVKFERQQARNAEFQKNSGDAKMAGRQASDKQLGFLRKLGCNQTPKDALEASRLIEKFRKK